MKVLILAGGKGTRFMEETKIIPKPMIKLNGTPMIFYIMNHYHKYGLKEFVILGGIKIEYIYQYFKNNFSEVSEIDKIYNVENKYNVQILDTGQETMTGGRGKRAINELNVNNFMLTYGDGISDVNIDELKSFNESKDCIATLTAVRPPARFGSIEMQGDYITSFGEKNQSAEGWVNGGFFIMKSEISDYIKGDEMPLEREPLETIADLKKLTVFKHHGYWQPVDTIREKEITERYLKEQNDQ